MSDRTVVIGGGHVGITLYADILRARPEAAVTVLTSRTPPFAGQAITMHDIVTGVADTVTTGAEDFLLLDNSNVLSAATIVFVTVPDIPSVRRVVIDLLLTRLGHKNATIVMIRGGQGGALWLAGKLRDPRAARWNMLLVEDSLYGCRVDGSTVEYNRKASVGVAHYGRDLDRAISDVAQALGDQSWKSRFCERSPIELLFDPLGYYIHTAVTLDPSNVVRTARGERYLHYSEGIDPTLAQQLDAMDVERVGLALSYGVHAETFPQILQRQYGHEPRSDFFSTMAATRTLYRSLSPVDVRSLRLSRNLREDIPALFTMLAFAGAQGFGMPTTEAFAAALPYLLGRVGLTDVCIDRYLAPAEHLTGDDLRSLLDNRIYA
ncbi:NAD/NADP octopine/nopaline dehydrogenase family protein [Nocardia sp. NPDC058497]|uniref:NAD/NADP octopine/nopaline dehydrogenase family protein n=1 Tax=Nocardia sp. NPDC058497 TaxID=3346529 RepID=UPI0036573516